MRVNHFELPSDDPERAVDFYTRVFEWTIEKWDGPADYWLIRTGPDDEPGIDGGIARRTTGAGGAIPSISVPSVAACLERIERAGGRVVRPEQTIPGVGTLAYGADPDGNVFGLFEQETAPTS